MRSILAICKVRAERRAMNNSYFAAVLFLESCQVITTQVRCCGDACRSRRAASDQNVSYQW